MKRSRQIRLVLIGSASAAMLGSPGSCLPAEQVPLGRVYTNDFYHQGAGYYHAPYRDWYPFPFNYYDSSRNQYFHGGNWTDKPHESITNLSSPLRPIQGTIIPVPIPVNRSDPSYVTRSGFGSGSSRFIGGGS